MTLRLHRRYQRVWGAALVARDEEMATALQALDLLQRGRAERPPIDALQSFFERNFTGERKALKESQLEAPLESVIRPMLQRMERARRYVRVLVRRTECLHAMLDGILFRGQPEGIEAHGSPPVLVLGAVIVSRVPARRRVLAGYLNPSGG